MGLKEPTLAGWVKKQLGESYPIYRLDRGTSGVVIFAKTTALAKWFQENPPQKFYVCATRGHLPVSGIIDHPLPNRQGTQKVTSQTRYRRIRTFKMGERFFSWAMAKPQTGRIHQIRKHFKHLSHPLLGDVKYGKGDLNKLFKKQTGCERLILHARTVILRHPQTNEIIKIKAEFLPEEQEAFLMLNHSPLL